jgi:hypothetical protein
MFHAKFAGKGTIFTRISPVHCVPVKGVEPDPGQTAGRSRRITDPTGHQAQLIRARGKVKPAGKPGSVTGIAPYDGHSSRPWVTPGLQPPTRGLERATHSTPSPHVQRPPIWCCSGWRLPRFTPWAPDARTNLRDGPKDSSLWPYSSSSPQASPRLVRTAVSRHPALWSPDFPLRAREHAATVWPASHVDSSTRGRAAVPRAGIGYFFLPLRAVSPPPRRAGAASCSSDCLRPGRKCWVSS